MTLTFREVRKAIRAYYRRLKGQGGWRAVGREFGISGGMAFRIAQQRYEPKDAHIRTTLHLPALVPAPVCMRCGEVHVTSRCTKGIKPMPSRWLDWPIKKLREAINHREEF